MFAVTAGDQAPPEGATAQAASEPASSSAGADENAATSGNAPESGADSYDGPPLSMDEAGSAAESYGFDTSNMEIRYVSKDDPYYLPDKYGWTQFNGADKPILPSEGKSITELTDLALRSPREAVLTIGHELAHTIFEAPYDHEGAEEWALEQMG